jgi:cation transport ATPase
MVMPGRQGRLKDEAFRDLHALGLRVATITGDSQAVADSAAPRLGDRRRLFEASS